MKKEMPKGMHKMPKSGHMMKDSEMGKHMKGDSKKSKKGY